VFDGVEAHAPKIYSYDGKWTPDSAAYIGTWYLFGVEESDPEATEKLKHLALACWILFGFSGYARVDFRVSATGTPFIIDVNPNPYLTPDDTTAAAEAGMSFKDLIAGIVSLKCSISARGAVYGPLAAVVYNSLQYLNKPASGG